MKNNKMFLLSLIMLASSCTSNSKELTILTPTGAPALAFYNYANNDNYKTNSVPKNIVSSMTKNGEDIVVIDTITGLNAINNEAPYKLAANITFGNYYIASTGIDDNDTMDKDDEIVIFAQGQTPDKIFTLIYGNEFTNINYVSNVSDAATCLISKKTLDNQKDVKYVFVAQPVLTNALAKNKDAKIYANIQDEYKKKTQKELIQAGLFIKDSATKKDCNKFLESLEMDINELLKNEKIIDDVVKNYTEDSFKMKYGIPSILAKNTLKNGNSIGLGFKLASENLENIKEFANLFSLSIDENKIYKK